MDAIGPPPTAAPTAAPVPAPTSSDCEAHPEMPISAARTATAMLDLIICFSVVNENATETITAAILATVGVQLLPMVTARRPPCRAFDDLLVALSPNSAHELRISRVDPQWIRPSLKHAM